MRERWTNDDRTQSGVWPLSKFGQQLMKGVRTGKAEAIAITKLMMNIPSKQNQRFVWICSQVTVILRLKYVDLVFSIVLYTNLSWNNCLNINALNSGAHKPIIYLKVNFITISTYFIYHMKRWTCEQWLCLKVKKKKQSRPLDEAWCFQKFI